MVGARGILKNALSDPRREASLDEFDPEHPAGGLDRPPLLSCGYFAPSGFRLDFVRYPGILRTTWTGPQPNPLPAPRPSPPRMPLCSSPSPTSTSIFEPSPPATTCPSPAFSPGALRPASRPVWPPSGGPPASRCTSATTPPASPPSRPWSTSRPAPRDPASVAPPPACSSSPWTPSRPCRSSTRKRHSPNSASSASPPPSVRPLRHHRHAPGPGLHEDRLGVRELKAHPPHVPLRRDPGL